MLNIVFPEDFTVNKYPKTTVCSETTNTGVAYKTDNPLNIIRNPIPRKPDNTLKGIRNLVPNEVLIHWPRGLTVPT